jgi:hypothetical protein
VETVEIRSWPARGPGPILLRTAGRTGERPEARALASTPELAALAACDAHRNDPAWFGAKGLCGFVFQNPRLIAYHACPGRTLFFTVEGITLT